MQSETDITRIVRSWLRTDEHESADRVLEDVLLLLDATQQRRPVWPARRIADMNTYAKLLVAAVAVAVVAVVGINLLPAGGVGGPPLAASPSPSPAPTPSAIAIGSPAPTVIFPPAGPLAAGRHTLTEGGTKFSIQVPDGWSSSGPNCSGCVTDDGWLQKGRDGSTDPGSVWAPVWNVDGVVADPCTRTAGPIPKTATELADAVASLPGTDLVTAPEDVTVGGHPAKHVVIKVRDDIGCPHSQFFMWGVGGIFRFATALGETNQVWIVEVNGTRFWFEAETYKGASPELGQEIQDMVDSIQFE
jgi:hypothetical protein